MRRVGAFLVAGLIAGAPTAAPVLPAGMVVEPPGDLLPRQTLRSEAAGGSQSFLVALGNAAFSAPAILGEKARVAGLSCNSCHTNGHRNAAFFVPGQSGAPGTFDPRGPLFRHVPAADAGTPVRIPSLRGVRDTAPYGHDGREASLRAFTHGVVTEEFGGAEPPALILDALVAYMEEFDWLAVPRLAPDGTVRRPAAAEARGAAAFTTGCAGCHVPSTAFTDRRRHDIGTGAAMDTPSLRGALFNAPYLHDGRAPSLEAAVRAHAGLGDAWNEDLAAYLAVIGDGELPEMPVTFRSEMAELATYVEAIGDALERQEFGAAALVADTVAGELGRLARRFPVGDPEAGRSEPVAYDGLTAALDAVATAARARHADQAEAALRRYLAAAEEVVGRYSARLR